MQTTVDTALLKEKLELASRVSVKHVTLPVLQCVLIEAENDTLTLRTTNLELGIEASMAANVAKAGAIAVPAQTLLQTVALHAERDIELSTSENTLILKGRGSETKIKSIPHEEFPKTARQEGAGQKLHATLFAQGVKTAAFAASLSSIKPELGSILVHQKKEHTLTFTATDSFRLMEKTVPQKGVVLDLSLLIPQKNALLIASVCEAKGGEPLCFADENQFSLLFDDNTYVTTRLTSGSFPDYEQIIPKEFASAVTILREDLVRAFKKTNIFLNKFLQVRLTFADKKLTVASESAETGTTSDSMPAEIDGEELALSFNQRYVAEALPHFAEDSVVLKLAGIGRPMVIVGMHDTSLRYLVMPMNK